jgi:diacylglycerol kinase family enzyme
VVAVWWALAVRKGDDGRGDAGAAAAVTRMRIGVITNLKAGSGATDSRRVLDLVRAHPEIKSVVTDRSTNVREVFADFAADEIDVLVVNGGDGTLQRTLTELLTDPAFERHPLIAPLRSGRTNSSARDLGVGKDPVLAMDRIIDLSRNGGVEPHLVRRDVLKVTLDPDGASPEVHFGMFCGFGVIDRAIRETHRRFAAGRAQGAFGGAVMTALLVGRLVMGRAGDILAPDRMAIRLDDESLPDDSFHLVIASTMERVFLGLRPFWGEGDAPVRTTAIAAGVDKSVRKFWRVVRGRTPAVRGELPGYVSRNVECADLTVDCGLTIDGELFDARPGRRVRIEAQQKVSFVRP